VQTSTLVSQPDPGFQPFDSTEIETEDSGMGDQTVATVAPMNSVPIIGRTVELAQIANVIESARAGRSAGIILVGEPGIGKSRMLHEAARMAVGSGLRVATAACLPLTVALPLDPVLELLRSLDGRARRPSFAAHTELFSLALERLERLSVDGPLLLCVDDLQWSDAGTIDFIHYCLSRLCDLPFAWVLATRSGRKQLAISHRLERTGAIQRVMVRPLGPADTSQLAEEIIGTKLGISLVDAVRARTGGNPFLSLQIFRAMSDARALGDDARIADAAPVPPSLVEAIDERASRLSAGAQHALEWAAVLGGRFSVEELEALAGSIPPTVMAELEDAGFLVDDRGDRSFAHDILRDAIYVRLSVHERARRHGAAADALSAGPIERLAPQLVSARRWIEAAACYVELGDRALNAGQGDDAAALFERAADLAARVRDWRLARSARGGRVLALMLAGKNDEARSEALELRQQLQVAGQIDERLSFLSRFATRLILGGDFPGAREALTEAEPLIERAEGSALAEALAARAWLALGEGQVEAALADAEHAANLAPVAVDSALRARVFNVYGLAAGMARSAREGIAILEEGALYATGAGLPTEAARARLYLAHLSRQAGDLESVERHLRLGVMLKGAEPSLLSHIQALLGHVAADAGDLEAALAYQLDALRKSARGGARRVALVLAYTYFWRGELAAMRRLLEQFAPWSATVWDSDQYELWGILLEAEGDAQAALDCYKRGAAHDNPTSLWCEAGVARVAAAISDREALRAAVSRLDAAVVRSPGTEWLRSESRAWQAVVEQRMTSAVAEFRRAADACPSACNRVRLRLEAARLAADREELRAATLAFDSMGARRAGDRARAIAREMGLRIPRQRTRGLLSHREQEIAQLVAAGWTNAEIAAELYLSPKTVERHISNILAKLQFRSRVEIAAEAAAGRLPGVTVDAKSEHDAAGGARVGNEC
jgi:DNA-binding CsgD family transcriptional regulator